MEFFAEIAGTGVTPRELKNRLTISSLPQYCASVDRVFEDAGSQGSIYCLWGEFLIHREEIRYGLRFSLPGCPNALAWTITCDETNVVIHCTIDKRFPDEDFIESIKIFISDWAQGITNMAPVTGE